MIVAQFRQTSDHFKKRMRISVTLCYVASINVRTEPGMPKFLFAYHGGTTPETRQEGEKAMAAWAKWFGNMGASLINGGNPVGRSMIVSMAGVSLDGGTNPISGYTVISAESAEEACEMAKACPMVADASGTVVVAPIIEI